MVTTNHLLSYRAIARIALGAFWFGWMIGGGNKFDNARSNEFIHVAEAASHRQSRIAIEANGNHLWVSPLGKNSNQGSSDAPFRTIQFASEVAGPGTTVHVAPGTYRQVIHSRSGGSERAPIRFVSDPPGAAIIRPSGATGAIWQSDGDHVTIQGFEIDGTDSPASRNGLYLTGGHNFAVSNTVHDILQNGSTDAQGGGGIVLGGSYYKKSDQHALGNCVYRIATEKSERVNAIYHQSTGSIINNIVHDNPGAVGIGLWHDARDIVIANNTIYKNSYAIAIGAGDYYGPPESANHILVVNNIAFDNADYGIGEMGSTGPENLIANNLVFGNGVDWNMQNGGRHHNDVSADPEFENYENDDVRLRPRSPAIDTGTWEGAAPADFEGSPRLGKPDLGALEWWPDDARHQRRLGGHVQRVRQRAGGGCVAKSATGSQ